MELERTTCWTLVRAAAGGDAASREDFVARYQAVVRAYLAARWRGTSLAREVDEASQEVFVECLKDGGVLERAAASLDGEFRAFLLGATRNVARRTEERAARRLDAPATGTFRPDDLPGREESISAAFDRAWARMLVGEARRRLELAANGDAAAARRVEILRLRFQDGLAIHTIARRWGEPAAALHRAYAKACGEFEAALREVVAESDPSTPEEVGRRCRALLELLA